MFRPDSAFHLFKAFFVQVPSMENIGSYNYVRGPGLQIVRSIFGVDPASDLHTSGISGQCCQRLRPVCLVCFRI